MLLDFAQNIWDGNHPASKQTGHKSKSPSSKQANSANQPANKAKSDQKPNQTKLQPTNQRSTMLGRLP